MSDECSNQSLESDNPVVEVGAGHLPRPLTSNPGLCETEDNLLRLRDHENFRARASRRTTGPISPEGT